MGRPKKIRGLLLLDGSPREAFGRVNVLRHEVDGTRLLGVAQPDDLETHEAFQSRFGGGAYTLVARSPDNRRIAARFAVALEGAPKLGEDAPFAKPPGRRAGEKAATGERPHATAAGALEATVFKLLRSGQTLEQIVEATHVSSKVLRAIYVEWLTAFGEEAPKSSEEIAARAKVRREQRLDAWNRARTPNAASEEGSNSAL